MMESGTKGVHVTNKFQQISSANSLLCKECNKKVYEMEKVMADQFVYHKSCFKCTHCKRILTLGTYTAAGANKLPYCKPHFMELFKVKGNYDEGFGMEKKSRPAGMDTYEGIKVNDKTSSDTKKAQSKWDKPQQSTVPPPINRTTDDRDDDDERDSGVVGEIVKEELPEEGTTRGLLAKFRDLQTNGGQGSPAANHGQVKQPIRVVEDTGRVSDDDGEPVGYHGHQDVDHRSSGFRDSNVHQDDDDEEDYRRGGGGRDERMMGQQQGHGDEGGSDGEEYEGNGHANVHRNDEYTHQHDDDEEHGGGSDEEGGRVPPGGRQVHRQHEGEEDDYED